MEILYKYFRHLNDRQAAQFAQLAPLYEFWNSKVNLVAGGDIPELYVRHVLHSLSIAKMIEFAPGSRVLDLGTGGGFPGIPLAIYFPEAEFHLVDVIEKKTQVVQSIATALGLLNVIIEKISAEDLRKQYDFVVCRAVTTAGNLSQWGSQLLRDESLNDLPNGLLMLKGGNLSAEMSEVRSQYHLFPIASFFDEDYFEDKYIVYLHS